MPSSKPPPAVAIRNRGHAQPAVTVTRTPPIAGPRRLTREGLRLATTALCRHDGDLAQVVRRFGHPPLWARRPGFATLVRIILEQQVSLASARAVYSRLRREAGAITPRSIAALGVEGLRGSGLTRQKASYCHELAVLIDRHELDLGRIAGGPDGVAREALLRVRGLGPWSVDIYFLMALRRPDVWPHGDLALAEAAFRVKRLPRRPAPDELSRLAAQWSPWRSVAARILWHFYLSERAARASDGRPHA